MLDPTPSDKELAGRRNVELNLELDAIRDVVRDKESFSLGTKTKLILKITGVTLASIAVEASLVISSIALATTSALGTAGSAAARAAKAAGKTVAKWLWDLAKNVAAAIPGILGSLLSWLLKNAAEAVNCLAEHTWLLLVLVGGLFL